MASRFTAGGHFWIAVCCPHAFADGLRRIRGFLRVYLKTGNMTNSEGFFA